MKAKVLTLGLALFFLFAYCQKGIENPHSANPSELLDLPVIEYFTASGDGERATLSWKVTNSFRVEIDNGIGEVLGQGIRIVSVTKTTTYVLTATNADGQVQASCTVLYSPRLHVDIGVTMSIAISDATPFQNENDYLIFHPFAMGERMPSLTINQRNPSYSSNKTIELELQTIFNDGSPMTRWGEHACWELVSLRGSTSEWLATAQFQCRVQLVPITTGIKIEAQKEYFDEGSDQLITFTGWTVGESKAVYFTIIKE